MNILKRVWFSLKPRLSQQERASIIRRATFGYAAVMLENGHSYTDISKAYDEYRTWLENSPDSEVYEARRLVEIDEKFCRERDQGVWVRRTV